MKFREHLFRFLLFTGPFKCFSQTPEGAAATRFVHQGTTICGFSSTEIASVKCCSAKQLEHWTRIHRRIGVGQQRFGSGGAADPIESFLQVPRACIDVCLEFGACNLELWGRRVEAE